MDSLAYVNVFSRSEINVANEKLLDLLVEWNHLTLLL